MLKVGDKAPDFTLKNQDENSVSLSDYKNKKVVLWFYPKASTPGWTIEGKGFRDEFQEFEEKNVEILGCSADPPVKQKQFAEKRGFPYLLLSDESRDMLKAYGVWGKKKFPYFLLTDENHEMLEDYGVWGKKKFMGREYMGISRVTYIIDENGIIEKVYEKVSVKSHARDILNDFA